MIISAVVAVFLLGDALLRGGAVTNLLLAPWVLLALWGVYVAVFASTVVTDADGIRVQNFVRVTRIPWSAVADIRMRYQLVIETAEGRTITSFGGPVSARATGRGGASGREGREPSAVRDTDRIRDDWHRAIESTAVAAPVRRGWDLPATVALGALVVWAAVAVVVAASG